MDGLGLQPPRRLKVWLEVGVQPEPEYNPGDWQCRSCPFLTVCGNVEPEPAGDAHTVAEFADAVRGFQIAEVNGDEKGKKAERQSMAAYLVESELPRLTVEQDGQEHTVSLRTTPKTDVDLKLLATLLSREDYERVVALQSVAHRGGEIGAAGRCRTGQRWRMRLRRCALQRR